MQSRDSGGGSAPPESPGDENLDDLRERISRIDQELVARAAERVALARRAGELKRRRGIPTVDYAQERIVVERARRAARDLGLGSEVAEDLMAGLIRASVTAQDDDNLRLAAVGTGKTAVVLGGAGRMGRWMVGFLSAQGFRTGVIDPAAPAATNDATRQALASADLVVCSTPPAATARLYLDWTQTPPSGVVVDIASIKTPLLEPIRALQRAGGRVASIHPMFGPSTYLLRDADVVVCETGDPGSIETVESLFQPTTARLVRVPLADHDRIMADLLSLAHACAIAFALALPPAEPPVRSTSFRALESLAAAVVRESPEVYFEIQAKNPHSPAAIERLRAALDRLAVSIRAQDVDGFRSLLEEGRRRTRETQG
jgi:chorismate mutase / prephenate dehydrogenase